MKKVKTSITKPGYLLFLILIAAVFLRFHGLDYQSLWNDEFYSLWASSFPTLKEVFAKGIIPDTHPPVFQVILWIIIKVLGNSETLLRAPSAVCGVLSVLGVYLIGKELYSFREGLIGSAIMAISWVQIYYSQEARSGMLMVFASTYSVLFWLKILEKMHKAEKIDIKTALPYFLITIFSCYVHYFCVLFVALQALLSFVIFRDNSTRLKQLLILYLSIGLGYLPWLPSVISQFKYHQDYISWIDVPKITALPKFWIFIFEENIIFAGFIAVIILIYFFNKYKGNKISAFFRNNPEEKYPIDPDLLLLYWFVIPLAIVFLVSVTLIPLFIHRYFLFIIPAIYLLLAHCIAALQFKTITKILIGALTLLFILYSLLFSRDYYSRKTKEPFREVAQYISTLDTDNTLLVTNAPLLSLEYYFEKYDSDLAVDLRVNIPKSDEYMISINNLINEKGSTSVLYVKEFIGGHNDPELEDQLAGSMELIDKQIFAPDYYRHRIEVYLFTKNDL